MKANTRCRYGMRLLIDLANHAKDGPVPVGDISRRQNISLKYLEQLIHMLKKALLIKSVRGAKGGHLLAKEPREIFFGHIIRMMEGTGDDEDCFCRKEKCGMMAYCPLNEAWQRALEAFYMELDRVSIADLAKKCCK